MLICPNCAQPLSKQNNAMKCPKGHSFDIAAAGYCNLLTGSKPGDFIGDSKEMVAARRRFLDSGAYEPLRQKLCELVLDTAPAGAVNILDAGCGEGYYTGAVAKAVAQSGRELNMIGADISKSATAYAAKRDKLSRYITANSYKLPIENGSADIILSLFAPAPAEEFKRILKETGRVIMAVPGTEHLWELKEAIYDEPYKNDEDKHSLEGFKLQRREKLSYRAKINGADNVQALFSMTPYIHRTGRESMERLRAIEAIELTLSFVLLCYEREAPHES